MLWTWSQERDWNIGKTCFLFSTIVFNMMKLLVILFIISTKVFTEVRTINFKDRFIHAQPLLHNMKTLNIFQINLFNIIFFMFKCKQKIAPAIIHSLFLPRPENKYNIRSRGKLKESFYRKKVPSLTMTIVVLIYGMNWLMIVFAH